MVQDAVQIAHHQALADKIAMMDDEELIRYAKTVIARARFFLMVDFICLCVNVVW
jgi:hypothetical protein